MFDAFGEVFTAEWLEKNAGGHGDPSPIFVVGQPRTGTTLVERIITSHSQVYSAGELKQFGQCVRRLADYREPKRHSARLARLAADVDSEKLGKAYIRRQVAAELPLYTADFESAAESKDRAPEPQSNGCVFRELQAAVRRCLPALL